MFKVIRINCHPLVKSMVVLWNAHVILLGINVAPINYTYKHEDQYEKDNPTTFHTHSCI